MSITLAQLASFLSLPEPKRDAPIFSVVIDSREAKPQSLFVALPGEHTDGHNFVPAVVEKGGFALVKRGTYEGEGIFPVDCPLEALQRLAKEYLATLSLIVVGITGSNGKTTTKDLIQSVLAPFKRVHKTWGNYNNELGVPLTILSTPRDTEVLILEMGMRAKGEIRLLTQIAPLDYGVITNIGPVHLERLGSMEAIAKAKEELLLGLKPNGVAILNGDDPYIQKMITDKEKKCFGLKESNALYATDIALHEEGRVSFQVHLQGVSYPCFLPLLGRHSVYNALAAIQVGLSLGLDLRACIEGLSSCEIPTMRLEAIKLKDHGVLFSDCYNASPASMASALEVLAWSAKKPSRVAILGDMYELGFLTEKAHEEAGLLAGNTVDRLVFVGRYHEYFTRGVKRSTLPLQNYMVAAKNEEVLPYLRGLLCPWDRILVKASRGVQLEVVVSALVSL